jgi:hypothetical protein
MLLQTGLHKEDVINLAHSDPSFKTVKYPKIIEVNGIETSAWPERFPIAECIAEREDYKVRNQYHIWLREYGCKIVSRETAPLKIEWLREYRVLPTNLEYYIGLDPASSKKKTAHRSAVAVIGVQKVTGDVFLVDYFAQQGKNPDELWEWVVNRWMLYRPRMIGVETIAYQEMLAWYFEKKMLETQRFFPIERVKDRRAKSDRIIQAFTLASYGKFWISPNHSEFRAGWVEWTEESDWDLGDATAQAIALANPWLLLSGDIDSDDMAYPNEDEFKDLVYEGGAP